METIVIVNFYAFAMIGFIGTVIGLDLKKWSSWLYGIYGFVSGLLFELLRADTGLALGLLFAFAVMYGGATTYWHKQRGSG